MAFIYNCINFMQRLNICSVDPSYSRPLQFALVLCQSTSTWSTCFQLSLYGQLVFPRVSFGWLSESRRLIGSLRDVTEGTPSVIDCLVPL